MSPSLQFFGGPISPPPQDRRLWSGRKWTVPNELITIEVKSTLDRTMQRRSRCKRGTVSGHMFLTVTTMVSQRQRGTFNVRVKYKKLS